MTGFFSSLAAAIAAVLGLSQGSVPAAPPETPSAVVQAERAKAQKAQKAQKAKEAKEKRARLAKQVAQAARDVERAAARRAEAERAAAVSTPPFRVAVFNVLGSNHTRPGGGAAGFAPARVRMQWSLDKVSRIGADVIGFSELQPDQLSWFVRSSLGRYDVWPGGSLGYRGIPTNIAWNRAAFSLQETRYLPIPFMDQTRFMPLVRLRSRTSGEDVWVMNIHNAPGGMQRQRDIERAKEIAFLREIAGGDVPLLVIGDFNERERVFCDFSASLGLQSPRGGSWSPGACNPPDGRLRVDWIFGSRSLTMDGYREDQDGLVRRITDHAVISSRVVLP